MEIKQLRYFKRVAEMGSVSKAAAALSVAQPAISRQIAHLEAELGTPLFYRNGRGVSMTEAGQALFARVSTVLEELRRAEQEVRDMIGVATGSVTLGTPPTVAQVFVVPLIKRLRARHPHLSLEVAEAFSGYVNEWLTNGALDVAVLYDAPRTRHLATEELLSEKLFYIASPEWADAGGGAGDTVRLADLTDVPMILPRRPHGLRLLIDRMAGTVGVDLDVVSEIDALSVIRELVTSGVGATILPYVSVHREVEAGTISARLIVDPALSRTLVLATSSQRPLTVSTRAVIKELKDVVRQLVDDGLWQGATSGRR